MPRKILSLMTVAAMAAAMPACTTLAKATGATKTTPNEFNILTKAPLVVPPEYNLRPPQGGQARLEEGYSSKVAREALLGNVDDAEPSRGEMILMSKAGVGRADPEVRVVINGQNSVEHKSGAFTDRVIFWRDGKAIDSQGNPLNADTEAQRLESINSATGGGKVTISKRPNSGKLPGL